MTVGYFTVDRAARTAKGYLIPYGVKSKGTSSSNTAPITFPKGNIRIPRDPMVIGLNDEHQRFKVLGRAVTLEDHDAGVYAVFSFADTDDADAWLAEHPDGAHFSAEIDALRRMPGDIGAGVLAGAAVTAAPAFDGTYALFSLIGDETDDPNPATEPTPVPEPSPDDPTPEPSPDDPEPTPDDEPEPTTEDVTMGEAVAPAQFSRPTPRASKPLSKGGFMTALHTARRTGDAAALRPYADDLEAAGLFALTDVTYDDAAGLATQAAVPGAWLGELWQGRRFSRRIVPLITSGVLTAMKAAGWIWETKPEVSTWAGNKTPITSTEPTVSPEEFTAQRFAGGNDLAREFYDFNVTEVIESYVQAMVDSYARKSDAYALAQLTAGATAFTPGAAADNKGLMGVIDGALAVVAAEATPTFALVAPDVFRDVIATPHSDALEYFDAAVGLDGGSSSGFSIIPDARLTAGQVIVGDRGAATAWELPGSPIRVSLPDLVKGGVDEAFFGYIAVGVTYPAAVVKATLTLA